jgi:S1-C subfamily serine protease
VSYIASMQHPSALTELANTLGGLPILGCSKDSPAGRAGLCYGDIVLSLDGAPTPTWAAFFQISTSAERTAPLRVRMFRHGRQLELALSLPRTARCPRAVLDAEAAPREKHESPSAVADFS